MTAQIDNITPDIFQVVCKYQVYMVFQTYLLTLTFPLVVTTISKIRPALKRIEYQLAHQEPSSLNIPTGVALWVSTKMTSLYIVVGSSPLRKAAVNLLTVVSKPG